MKETMDTVALATQDVVNTIEHYQSKVSMLETTVTVAIIALIVVLFLAIKWGMTIRNAKKNGVQF